MAHRARLGIQTPEGTIRSVYLHDGYPDSVSGLAHIDNEEKVKAVIGLGYVSYVNGDGSIMANNEEVAKVAADFDGYIDQTHESHGDFIYLWVPGEGWYGGEMRRPTGMKPLADFIKSYKARNA